MFLSVDSEKKLGQMCNVDGNGEQVRDQHDENGRFSFKNSGLNDTFFSSSIDSVVFLWLTKAKKKFSSQNKLLFSRLMKRERKVNWSDKDRYIWPLLNWKVNFLRFLLKKNENWNVRRRWNLFRRITKYLNHFWSIFSQTDFDSPSGN